MGYHLSRVLETEGSIIGHSGIDELPYEHRYSYLEYSSNETGSHELEVARP